MTKTKFLLTTIAVLLCSVMANAHDFEVNGIYYNILSDTTVEVTFRGSEYDLYDEYSGSVTIPSIVTNNGKDYFVTIIGSCAFKNCSSLASVVIGNNITNIEDESFSGCYNLSYTIIPENVIEIDYLAFGGCSNLMSITIPEGVRWIGSNAFSGCSKLSSILIPKTVNSIGRSPFSNCVGLTSIVVDSCNGNFDSRNNCNAIIEKGSNCLIQGCKNTIIPQSVKSIEDFAFSHCSLLSCINIPDSVTRMGQCVFEHCSSLTSVTVGNNLENIGHYAFFNCSSLKSIVIPNSVTRIEDCAFRGCASLTSITIGKNVKNIESSAFYQCSSLKSISIPEGVECIRNYTFSGCTSLASVYLPNSITKIEKYAFEDCSSLASLIIPNNVTSIGENVFIHCSGLKSITIPNSITDIGGGAFYDCSSLTSVTIPNTIASIKGSTFRDCSNLTSVIIPNSIMNIGYMAFYGCSSLTSITIPNSVTSIGESAFADCMSLDTVIVEATTPPSTKNDPFYYPRPTCYVPCGTVEAYKASDWNQYCKAIIEPASEMQFNISISDSTQGRIIIDQQPTCSNDTLIFHAEPIPSHYFVQWSDGNTDNPRTIILTQDTALAAVFAIKTCKLDLLAEGNGTVTGAGTYNYGDIAIITARPDEHHHFVQWSDGNTDTLRTIVLTQDTSITARFAIDTYTLYLYAGENGIVTGAGTYDHGDTAIITATPNDGYYFTQWSDGNTENPRTIIVTEDVFLSANFIIGGQCGDSLYWTYEQSTKQLTLLGTGDMYDYTVWTLPWQKYTHMIRSISLPEGMTTIGTSAFADCKYVHSIVIPSSVERINDSAFENCRMLSEIQFGEDGVLTELGSWAFYNCHELKELAIPEGVTSVGYATFYGCTYLNELTLPATMEYIADNGFAYCAKLQKMTVNAITPPQVDARTFEDVDRTIPVYVPDESVHVYRSAPVWQEFNIQGKSGVPSNVDNVEASTCEVQKILRNGQLIIIRDGVEYNAMGMEL